VIGLTESRLAFSGTIQYDVPTAMRLRWSLWCPAGDKAKHAMIP